MDKRTKAKAITTIICMIISIFALYTFVFVAELSTSWRILLIIVAVSWIVSGILNLLEYFKRKGK